MAVTRFGVSLPTPLAAAFDKVIAEKGYTSRSEAVRDMIRNYLVAEEWQSETSIVVGTITLVYEHGTHELAHSLTGLQHRFHGTVVCSTHVHLDAHNCLEIIVLSGQGRDVRTIADQLISTRGVKHGKLVCTTTGRALV